MFTIFRPKTRSGHPTVCGPSRYPSDAATWCPGGYQPLMGIGDIQWVYVWKAQKVDVAKCSHAIVHPDRYYIYIYMYTYVYMYIYICIICMYIPSTSEIANNYVYLCLVKNQLLEGSTLKRSFFDETEVFGFWMVPANCDGLSGMGFCQFRRCGGDFRRMKNA